MKQNFFSLLNNKAWYFILILLISTGSFAQELTIYAIPPKRTLNWSSPNTLFISYMRSLAKANEYGDYSHPMGHIVVELKDSTHYILTGMVANKADGSRINHKVCFGGYGLGIFVTPLPGRLQKNDYNITDLALRYPTGDVAYMTFRLSPQAFARLMQYFDEYKEKGFDKIYNGGNKPREGKGAGCSAFGVSFIEVGKLLPEEELKKWQVQVNVPEKLIGGPVGNERWVGLHKVLFTWKWASHKKNKFREVAYYEPSMIFQWINRQWNDSSLQEGYTAEVRGKAKGLIYDVTESPVPGEPIWHLQTPPAEAVTRNNRDIRY